MTTNDEPKPATEGVHNPDVPDVAAELTRILQSGERLGPWAA